MAQSIKQLLSKKGWTGKEVGRALLLSLKHDIDNKGKNAKPLFSQEDFNRMVDSLNDSEYTQFKVLESIYGAIVDNFNRNGAMLQQFYNGYYRYFLSISEAHRAEDFFTTTEAFPLILTQNQYDQAVKDVEKQKRGKTESYVSLFFHTLRLFLWAIESEEAGADESEINVDVPAAIKTAILNTKDQRVTNKRILANWIDDVEYGYLTLPDGRRSDEMSSQEWQDALEEEFMKTHHLYVDGELQGSGVTLRHFHAQQELKACELLFKGADAIREEYTRITGKTLSDTDAEALESELEELSNGMSRRGARHEDLYTAFFQSAWDATWHYYDTVPDDLTKYDILSDVLGRYTGEYSDRLTEPGGEYIEEISERDQFKEFKKDYPELSDALDTFIQNAVPAANGLKANQLYKDLVTWGVLADLGFINFKDLVTADDDSVVEYVTSEDTTENLNKKSRGTFHGIAILKKARFFDAEKDGNYRDPVTRGNGLELLHGIDYLEKNLDDAEYIRETLDDLAIPALRFIYAYNAFIEILAEVYDVDFLTAAKSDMTIQESQIEACNNLLYMLYKQVYGTERDKKRKREFLREHFHPIDLDAIKPTEETIASVKEKIASLGYTRQAAAALRDCRPFVNALMNRGDAE